MALRCKPGQLARVLPHELPEHAGIVDMIVRVTKVSMHLWTGEPVWSFEEAPLHKTCTHGHPMVVDCLPDAILKPIEDPPADAVDEMVKLAGKAPVLHGDWEAA